MSYYRSWVWKQYLYIYPRTIEVIIRLISYCNLISIYLIMKPFYSMIHTFFTAQLIYFRFLIKTISEPCWKHMYRLVLCKKSTKHTGIHPMFFFYFPIWKQYMCFLRTLKEVPNMHFGILQYYYELDLTYFK